MQPSELNRRVLQLLAQERALHGHGSAAEIDQRLGRSEGYLGRVLRGEIGLQTEMLFRILDALGIDASAFFTGVVGLRMRPEGCLDRLARRLAERSEIPFVPIPEAFLDHLGERVARWPLDAPAGPRKMAEENLEPWLARLEEIDRRRFFDPESVRQPMVDLLPEALERAEVNRSSLVHHLALARALGVAASIERVEGRPRHAVDYLRAAFVLVADRDPRLYAELLQRSCYQMGDQGDYETGLEFALQATEIYVRHGDLPGVGRSMVDRAVMVYKLGTSQETLDLYRAGLQYLPPSAWQNRFAALQGMGMSHLNLGQVDEADDCAIRAAEAHTTHTGLNWWRLVWLQGEIAYRLGELERSENLFQQVKEAFAEAGQALDVALLSLQLARVLLAAGKIRDMQRLAASSMSLLRPLRRHRVACAALHEFTRMALTGDLTVRWIEQASSRLELGHPDERGTPVTI